MSTRNSPEKQPLALIAGPTASGKSALATQMAQEIEEGGINAVIINADSAQVYADLRVLSARPSDEEMAGIPHRLFGTWDGATACSAAEWAEAAKAEITKAHAAAEVPILVGGTGLYLRTLLDGIAPVPEIDGTIRTEIRGLSQSAAREALEREDPGAASRLAAGDTARTARALEVVRSTGRTLSSWQEERTGGIAETVSLHPLILLPERSALNARCDSRFAEMIEEGAAEEVAALLARCLDPSLPVMRAIGVREIGEWLKGRTSKEEAIKAASTATRRYAKRQFTWFRHQPPDTWPRIENYTGKPSKDILFPFPA